MNAIILSMLEWQEAMSSEETLQSIFTQGNMFNFNLLQPVGTNKFINTYPGIDVLNWKFNLVLGEEDIQTNYPKDAGEPTVVTCGVEQVDISKIQDTINGLNNLDSAEGQITKATALRRIERWNDLRTRNQWLSTEIANNKHIYEAFVMPVYDIVEGDEHQAFFALRLENNEYFADIIVINTTTNELAAPLTSVSYYDTVRPVPPFKPEPGFQEKDFGLLNYVLSIHEPV